MSQIKHDPLKKTTQSSILLRKQMDIQSQDNVYMTQEDEATPQFGNYSISHSERAEGQYNQHWDYEVPGLKMKDV